MEYLFYFLLVSVAVAKHDRDVSRYNYSTSVSYRVVLIYLTVKYFLKTLDKPSKKLENAINKKIQLENFRTWFSSNTYLTDSWWVHNVFSFVANGWKFWETVMMVSAGTLAGLSAYGLGIIKPFYTIPILSFELSGAYLVPIVGLFLHMVWGGLHSILDGSMFRER